MTKTLGERIRELRQSKDLSLREFAKKLGGLSAAFLSDVELGRRYPAEEVLIRMAEELGTTLNDLKVFDTRPPLEELKRLARSNPEYGIALRRVVEEDVSADELMKLAKRKSEKGKEK